MSTRNSLALRPLPSASSAATADMTVATLQRWCYDRNAQIIFNCDGTVYAAVDGELRHSQYRIDLLAANICDQRK
ncbi:MAG: hypothetical protein ACJ8IK_00310 [Burkholderiaceae bacterium]